jgi:hypothetical protein
LGFRCIFTGRLEFIQKNQVWIWKNILYLKKNQTQTTMKNLLIILLSFITANVFCNSIDTIQVESKITDVTVFFSGAQITRNIDLKLAKGKHLIVIDKLPKNINPQSIQVDGIENCKILSVMHQIKSQNQGKKNFEELEIEKKIESLELQRKEIKITMNVFDLEEKLILDNSTLGSNNKGTTISEIKEAADYYRLKLNEIRQGKLSLFTELNVKKNKIKELNAELNKLTIEKRKIYNQVLVAIDCEKDINTKLNMSYYISTARWTPFYDFRVDDIAKPLVIVYNANAFQISGDDWNNINIKLSTNNPSQSGRKPELVPWYLGRRKIYKEPPTMESFDGGALRGKVIDKETQEPIPFVNIVVEIGGYMIGGDASDFDGNFVIRPIRPGRYNIKATALGYKPLLIQGLVVFGNRITFSDVIMESTAENLDEFEIVEYVVPLIDNDQTPSGSSRSKKRIAKMPNRSANTIASTVGGVKSNKRKIETFNYISNSLKTTVTNLEYDIDIPYSIPSDGKDYSIKIMEIKLPVDYEYYAIPKLDNDAFLTAEITDWTELNLLSGEASIYFQGTYTGESFIDANYTGDTLNVSLGRDKNIIVKREGNKEIIDKRIIGNNIKETIGWDITVKNNKNTKINITVEDQYPLSEKKSVEVELLESSNAKVDEKTGKLTWELEMEPNEKKVFTYKYSVKYPKYLDLTIE